MILVVIYSCLIVFVSKIQGCEGLLPEPVGYCTIGLHAVRVHDVFYKPEADFSISVFVGK